MLGHASKTVFDGITGSGVILTPSHHELIIHSIRRISEALMGGVFQMLKRFRDL